MSRLLLMALLLLAACTSAPDAEVVALRQRQAAMEEQLSGMAGELERLAFEVKVTMYRHPRGQFTASTKPLRPGYHAAVSRSLERSIPLGSRVMVPGKPSRSRDGSWEVVDRTAWWIEGDVLDLSMGRRAKEFAENKVVEVMR